MRSTLAPRSSPLAIGLLGGSFNPAHEGHVHISEEALKALGLDEIWWLVSPQNPLKSTQGMEDYAERLATAKQIAQESKHILVSDIERKLGTRYTADTLQALQKRFPRTRFIWLMGADNLAGFHRWQCWERIMRDFHVCVLDRAPYSHAALHGKTALRFAGSRLPESQAAKLKFTKLPAWCYLHIKKHPLSATAIRENIRGEG